MRILYRSVCGDSLVPVVDECIRSSKLEGETRRERKIDRYDARGLVLKTALAAIQNLEIAALVPLLFFSLMSTGSH